jgi:hypothetical protein
MATNAPALSVFALLICSACELDNRQLEASDSLDREPVQTHHSSQGTPNWAIRDGGPEFDAGSAPHAQDAGMNPDPLVEGGLESTEPNTSSPTDAATLPALEAGSEAPALHCPDLDLNGVADCDETLVQNASFDEDAIGWDPEPDAQMRWRSLNASTEANSGSLEVANTFVGESQVNGFSAAFQCVAAVPGRSYHLRANVWISSEQVFAGAGFIAEAYDGDDCTGAVVATQSAMTIATDAWGLVAQTITVPNMGHSLKLRFGILKPFDATPATVLVDNVLLRPN